MKGGLYVREKGCCLQKAAFWCLEDGTAEQAKLVDCFIFQETVLQMVFQSETYCVDKQSNVESGLCLV